MIFDIFSARGRSARNNGATKQKMLYFSDEEVDCTPAPQDRKPVRFRRRHPDRSDRRRSANADILESVGLPPTVSYNDMKSLQDGLCIDDILGRRSSCSVRFKAAFSAVGGNATQAARRASRWSKKVTGSKLQKKALRQSFQAPMFHDEKDLPWPQQMSGVWKSDSLPQLEEDSHFMQPGQWLRQCRAFSDATLVKKAH